MADSFVMTANQVKVVDDNETVFEASSARRTLSYFPDEALTGTVTAEFHNPPQDTAYWWTGGASGGSPAYVERCASYRTLLSQECGPPGISDVDMDLTFPNILLGSVPDGTNYLDIQVRLTRTKDPDDFFDQPVRSMQPEGHWMSCQGYAVPLERMSEFRRHVDFFLSGNKVYLRRYQSTNAVTSLAFDPDNDEDTNDAWTYTTTPSGSRFVLLDYKQIQRPTTGWTLKRDGSDHCKLTDSTKTDLSSDWQIEYVITPGRLDVSAVPPSTPKPSIRFGGLHFSRGSATTRTWSGVPLLSAKATRRVVVYVGGYAANGDDVPSISSVKIGGVTATKIIEKKDTYRPKSGSLWIASVPSGTTGDVVATWTETTVGQLLAVWTLYDLTSNSDFDSAGFGYSASGSDFSSVSVDVAKDGVVLAIAASTFGTMGEMTGIDDVYSQNDNAGMSGNRGTMFATCGQEQTTSAGDVTIGLGSYSGTKVPEVVLVASFK